MTRHDWPEIFASNPDASDTAIASAIGVTNSCVSTARRKLGIPRTPLAPEDRQAIGDRKRVDRPRRYTVGTTCDLETYNVVNAAARADGVTTSTWALQAIVERMERVQGRMQRLVEPTDYIGHP